MDDDLQADIKRKDEVLRDLLMCPGLIGMIGLDLYHRAMDALWNTKARETILKSDFIGSG